MQLEVGSIVEGKVSGITNFGAFILLPDGSTGLVHISEIADEYVKDINDHLKQDQVVKVKVLSTDKNGRVSLSIKKAADPKPEQRQPSNYDRKDREPNGGGSFEDKLAAFMKSSDERLLDLKKNFESKRGSGSFKRTAHF